MKKKPAAIISVIIVVLLLGALVWALLSGSLSVAWNGVRVTTVVCDSTFVDEYNKATEYTYRADTDDAPSMDIEGMNKLADRIKESNGYASDPTCQVMLYWTAIEAKDSKAAESSLAALKDLHAKRAFPDNNLRTAIPLFEYDAALEYIQQDTATE